MSEPREGQRVSYVGEGLDLAVGDRGKVLSVDGHHSHVLWTTGVKAGEVTLTDHFDLVVNGSEARYDEDFESGTLVSVSVQETHSRYGKAGLLNALNDEGHLGTFAPIAEDAIQMVATRIREEPSFKEVLSHLDPVDGEEFVEFAAFALLRDAFGQEEII